MKIMRINCQGIILTTVYRTLIIIRYPAFK